MYVCMCILVVVVVDPSLTSTKGRLRNVTDCRNITWLWLPTYIKLSDMRIYLVSTTTTTHYTHISLLIGFMHHQPSDGELDYIAQQLSLEKSLKCNTRH